MHKLPIKFLVHSWFGVWITSAFIPPQVHWAQQLTGRPFTLTRKQKKSVLDREGKTLPKSLWGFSRAYSNDSKSFKDAWVPSTFWDPKPSYQGHTTPFDSLWRFLGSRSASLHVQKEETDRYEYIAPGLKKILFKTLLFCLCFLNTRCISAHFSVFVFGYIAGSSFYFIYLKHSSFACWTSLLLPLDASSRFTFKREPAFHRLSSSNLFPHVVTVV